MSILWKKTDLWFCLIWNCSRCKALQVFSLLLFVSHLEVISCALCNSFVCEFDDFLLCFVMRSCRISWILTSSELHIRINTVQKGVCRPKWLLPHDVKCCLFHYFLSSGYIMLESKLYFCGWSHVERSWSWPFQEYWLIISCHFCFLQDLSLMWCSLSIFFGLGPRITTFINYCIVYMKNLYWKEFAQLFQNARVYAE